MAWAKPEHLRGQVDRAGRMIVEPASWFGEVDPETGEQPFIFENWLAYENALAVVNNWRSAHSYPLNGFQTLLRYKVARVDRTGLVSQRIKRLPAIELKLTLHPTMMLSQMQDIGGCRAVVGSLRAVRRLVTLWEHGTFSHDLIRKTDYIDAPRESGYRSVHLIYRYHRKGRSLYNGLRIEMQIRSRLQHAWATAVETAGTFLRQALKSSRGNEDWLRFFALMGSVIAMKEGTRLVPGTPVDRNELIAELKQANEELQVDSRLATYHQALRSVEKERVSGSKFFLLVLDANNKSLTIRGFRANQLETATEQYVKTEQAIKANKENTNIETVLVSVSSLQALRHAYPSYFLDTSRFIAEVKEAIASV